MADLTAICADIPAGAPLQLQAELSGLWVAVGEGSLVTLTATRLAFAGTLSAIEPGPVSLDLTLMAEGQGRVAWRGAADGAAAWWDYDDGVVVTATLAGRAGELCLWPGDGGVHLSLAGAVSARLWLGRL